MNLPYYAAGALIDLFGKLLVLMVVIGLLFLFSFHMIPFVMPEDEEIKNKIEQYETER